MRATVFPADGDRPRSKKIALDLDRKPVHQARSVGRRRIARQLVGDQPQKGVVPTACGLVKAGPLGPPHSGLALTRLSTPSSLCGRASDLSIASNSFPDRVVLSRSRHRLAVELGKPRQKSGRIPRPDAVLGHLLTPARRQRGDQPDRMAQFQRNKNCAKLRADSGSVHRKGDRATSVVSRLSGRATSVCR